MVQWMDMKAFAKYLEYESFEASLHHVRRISMERIAENESLARTFQQKDERHETNMAVNR